MTLQCSQLGTLYLVAFGEYIKPDTPKIENHFHDYVECPLVHELINI